MDNYSLDFEAAMRGLDGDRWLDKDALNAQLRAIVARVAQEEREKALKEVLAVMRTHNPKGNTAQHVVDQTYEWLHSHLRGTP